MTAAILGDTHFGARNDSPEFMAHFLRFFDEIFIPECVRRGVTDIFQTGDLFDRRKYVNFRSYQIILEEVIRRVASHQIHFWSIVGNHDTYFKNTLETNCQRLLFGHEPWFIPIWEPREVTHQDDDGNPLWKVLLVPWICEDNRAQIWRKVAETDARFCLGHFELHGFDMYRGVPCEHGDDPKRLAKFDRVWSGHFHTRSQHDNVHYVGTPYDITWSDHGDQKGFLIVNDDGSEEWVDNPLTIHQKFTYDDSSTEFEAGTDYDAVDIDSAAGRYVKIVVRKVCNQAMFARFMERLGGSGAQAVQVVDKTEMVGQDDDDTSSAVLVAEKEPLQALLDEIDEIHQPRSEDEPAHVQALERSRVGIRKKASELYSQAVLGAES